MIYSQLLPVYFKMFDDPLSTHNIASSNLSTGSSYVDSIIDSSLSDKNFQQLSQLKLIKVKEYITRLLYQIRTLQQQILKKDSHIDYLQSELEAKHKTVRVLTASKNQIEQSVQKILDYNCQYLRIIEDKQKYIEELEDMRQIQQNQSAINTDCFTQRNFDVPITSRKRKTSHDGEKKFYVARSGVVENKPKIQTKLLQKIKDYVCETQIKFRRVDNRSELLRVSRDYQNK